MTVRQQWTMVAAIVLVLAAGLGLIAHSMKDELYPVDAGAKAPNFKVRVLGDSSHKQFADYKGQVVLLNVWATFCQPCIKEMPSLEKLHQTYGDKGLKIVAVSVDREVSEDSIQKFVKNLGVTFEVLHDSSGAIENQYQTTGYPETFIIGKEGTIRRKWIGADDWMSRGNRSLIAQLLGLEAPRAASESTTDAPRAADLTGSR